MTSLAEFTLPASEFPLGRVFDTRPDARFELDRVVPSGDTAMPYFWVYGSDMPSVLAILDSLTELRSVVLMDDLGDRGLFRAEWAPEHLGIMRAIAESGVTVLTATGSASGWAFQLRAEGTATLSAFAEFCETHDIDVTLTRLSRLTDATPTALRTGSRRNSRKRSCSRTKRGTTTTRAASTSTTSLPASASHDRRSRRGSVAATAISSRTLSSTPRTTRLERVS